MENINIVIFLCMAIPISMMLFVFKNHSRLLCIFLLTGMFMCILAGEINGFMVNNYNIHLQQVVVNGAPLIEEIAKALPVIFVAFLLKPSLQNMAEYSLAVGLGFATLENISTLIQSDTFTLVYAILRAVGAGMMHAVCTLLVGVAMSFVINKRIVFVSGTLVSLSIAVVYHSIYNMLINSDYLIVGVLLPTVSFIALMILNAFQSKSTLKQKK